MLTQGVDDPEEREYGPIVLILIGAFLLFLGGGLEVRRIPHITWVFPLGCIIVGMGTFWHTWRLLCAPGGPFNSHDMACLHRRRLLAERETKAFLRHADKLGAKDAKSKK